MKLNDALIEVPADASPPDVYGHGHRALSGKRLRLFRALDQLFLRWAQAFNAEDYQFPSMVPAKELNKIGYFKSFPHHLSFPASLHDDEQHLMAFTQQEPLTADGKVNLQACGCAPIQDVLTPAACYHFYINFQNQSLTGPRFLTTRATCFRKEKTYTAFRRQWSFNMREIVCIGTASEVSAFLDVQRGRVEHFFQALSLPVKWEGATDPFFNPSANPKYLAQRLDPVKTEMVFGGNLAIGSVNFHRNYFGESFRITRDGEDAYSGCVAFGLERWIHAFMTHFGDDENGWPDLTEWDVK